MKRPGVDHAFTFGISLVLSVVLWYPTLRGTMSGDVEITDSGIRYVCALAIAWAAVFGVSSLVARYGAQTRRPPSSPPDEGVRVRLPLRHETARPTTETEARARDDDADAA